MAVPFSQLISTTFDEVVLQKNKAIDQWSDSSFLKGMERLGGVKRVPGGAALTPVLDYRANAGADFLATDVTATSIAKTDVITMASYGWATLVVPANWTLTDEALNSDPNQKVDLIQTIVDNALTSHDETIEAGFFAATVTDGFNTLNELYTADGTGTVGTINAAVETWWKNKFGAGADATLIADLTKAWNSVMRGSSGKRPNVVVCGPMTAAQLEGKIQPLQRYIDVSTGKIAFKALEFKTAPVLFSKYCPEGKVFMFHTDDTKLYVVQSAWRERRQPIEFVDHAMMNMKVFSVCQVATAKRSGGALVTIT